MRQMPIASVLFTHARELDHANNDTQQMLKDKVRERKMRILETRYDTHDNVRILIARRKMRKLIVTLKVSRSKEEVVSSSSSISERRLTTCVGSVSHPCWLPTVYHWLWYVALYTDTTAIVLTSDGHTDPFLFVLAVDWMMRRALTPELIAECGICVTPSRSSRNPSQTGNTLGQRITCLTWTSPMT